MELNDTRNVSLTSSLFRGFVFVAAVTEKPDSHKMSEMAEKFLTLFWQSQGILQDLHSKSW